MRILQITNKSPYPPLEGGSIAMNTITQGLLSMNCSVKILTMDTPKNKIVLKNLPAEYINATRFESVYVDNRVKVFDALWNLIFTSKSYHLVRFISDEFRNKLIHILKNEVFDIVLMEMIYVTPYIDTIRKYSNAKIVLRTHNLEHLIWERLAQNSGFLKKIYLHIQSKRLKKYEISQFSLLDGIAAITPFDASVVKKYSGKVPVISIPVAVNSLNNTIPVEEPEYPGFFHLGSMNWMPNIEGIKWLLEFVWPRVQIKYPQIKLYLAGRAMPDWLMNLNMKNVHVLGEIPDAVQFISSKSVMLVPLLSGSGMRVKIIEGMQHGKTIISTSVGAEGIECTHGKDILIADSPEDFIECIDKIISDKNLGVLLGQNARTLIQSKYDNRTVTTTLLNFFRHL